MAQVGWSSAISHSSVPALLDLHSYKMIYTFVFVCIHVNMVESQKWHLIDIHYQHLQPSCHSLLCSTTQTLQEMLHVSTTSNTIIWVSVEGKIWLECSFLSREKKMYILYRKFGCSSAVDPSQKETEPLQTRQQKQWWCLFEPMTLTNVTTWVSAQWAF